MSITTDLGRWMSAQRWFQADTASDEVAITGSWQISSEPRVEITIVDSAGVLYVVPLLYSDKPLVDIEPISRASYVYDATALPEGQLALMNAINSTATGTGICQSLTGTGGAGVVASSARLTGEQSNTSIRYKMADGSQTILKVFRILTAGLNPDVILTSELAEDGFTHVPRPVGAVEATWSGGGPAASGHLLVAAEFMAGATDAWQVLTEAARKGPLTDEDADRIADLGSVVADMHAALASRLGTEDAADKKQSMVQAWRRRAAKAIADAPVLGEYAASIDATYDEVGGQSWPDLQRIHGDLHLGQVLDVPGRGWILLDFEGEPLRPLAERVQNDLAERDVAGMLRSFDYVAGDAISKGVDPEQAHAWADGARRAFLDGYGEIDHQDVLDALELDKALYEVSYETNQRPAWVDVPLGGVRALLSTPTSTTESEPIMTPAIQVPTQTLAALAEGRYHAPHDVLGPHEFDGGIVIRVVRHLAESVTIVTADGEHEATHEYGGVWYAEIPGTEVPDYRVRATYSEDVSSVTDDPYRFLPTIGEVDTYLFGEGRHEELWKVLGAHIHTYESVLGDVHGTSFAVWAPNASAVRVVGDFNQWNGIGHAMRSVGSSGVWEIFVPGAATGDRYKFEIQYRDGSWHQKADPMARKTEIPPSTASIITHSDYTWNDLAWMSQRAESNPLEGPISVYEVHLGSWRQGLSFKEMAQQLIGHVRYLGFTHVELMPIAEHPFGGSWGYQVSGYYAPTARFGDPDDFRYLVDELHKAGIGVIVDWVPAHFPKDSWALAQFDGTALYEDPDPLRGEHPDWGTLIFNYGRREVRNFLVANALYWLEEFHIDGIRVDAVASMLYLDYSREAGQWRPNVYGGRENLEAISFLQEANATAYRRNPGILMIAEESTSWPGVTAMTEQNGLGFGLKWNMGWMNDTLHYVSEEPINRRYHHGEITFSLVYAFSEQYLLPISHDEVVHGKGSLYRKMPGDHWQKLAGVRLLYAYQWAHPGKQLLFMGQEFAQIEEWNEGKGLDWWLTDNADHDQVMALVARLNEVYTSRPALYSDDFSNHGFEWIEVSDGDHNVLSFLRKSADDSDMVAAVINFAGTPHENYRVGVPHGGVWEEILNTDALEYGGSGVGNMGQVEAEPIPWNGRPYSINLRVPPLGALYFAPKK